MLFKSFRQWLPSYSYILRLALQGAGFTTPSPNQPAQLPSSPSPSFTPNAALISSSEDLLHRTFQLIDANRDGVVSTEDLQHHLHKLGLLDGLQTEQLACLVQSAASEQNGGDDGRGHGAQLQFENFKLLYEALCEKPDAHNSAASGNSHVNKSSDGSADDDSVVDPGLKDAFCVFDVDGDGIISVDELRRVLVGMGFAQCQDQAFCESIVKSADSNSDGLIDFGDFRRMMTRSRL